MLRGQVRPAILMTLVLCLITGFFYPGVVAGLAQLLFPWQANGSQIKAADGHLIGSALIGQPFPAILLARLVSLEIETRRSLPASRPSSFTCRGR